jgi:hypothetical protein
VAIPPQVNVIAAMIFVFTVAMMLLTVWQQRRAERMAAVQPEPEPLLVEADGAVEVGDGEVHGAKPQRCGEGGGLGRVHASRMARPRGRGNGAAIRPATTSHARPASRIAG